MHTGASADLANGVFGHDDDGDDDHDVEALLNTQGLSAGKRRWRVKWAGKNTDGSDRWPDLGDGGGTQKYG
jgi:hypothetical protein